MNMSAMNAKDHNAQWISISLCWIDVNEICTAEKLSPDKEVSLVSKMEGKIMT
jgi:hypothetical protein